MDEKVFIKKSTLTSIGDAIRSKEGTTELIPTAEMAARIEAISGGLALEESAVSLRLYSLNSLGKSDATLNLLKAETLDGLCYASTAQFEKNNTVEHLTINCPNAVKKIANMLNGTKDETLRHLTLNVDTSAIDDARYAFYGNYALEIIDGTPLDLSNVTIGTSLGNVFRLCYALREVRCKGTIQASIELFHSRDISKESVLNIFSCLSDDSVNLLAKFSRTAIDKLFETSEGAKDGSSSAEWLALVATKPNWNIAVE